MLKMGIESIESDGKLMYKIIEKSVKYLTQKSKSEKTEIKSEELKEEINNHEELVENIDKGKDFIKMNGNMK